jgi:ParB-like chromosome segregation protein Spo0J
MESDPLFNIQIVDAKDLKPNHWNPNRVLKSEYDLLVNNMLTLGWVQPIIINTNNMIIDGFHRWRIAQDIDSIKEKYKGKVPVVVLDIDDRQAMIYTIRMNRAKGVHASNGMQAIAKKLVNEYKMTKEQLEYELGMSSTEVDLLLSDSVLTARNSKDWKYNKAWYPIEDGEKYGKASE